MLHDPIPLEHVAELVASAAKSPSPKEGAARQSAILHSAWCDYAAKAARPYAWQTFALYCQRYAKDNGMTVSRERIAPLKAEAPSSPRVLVLGSYAALRVRDGALEIEHGSKAQRAALRIDVDARAKPEAILFDSLGEFVAGRGNPILCALRNCADMALRAGQACDGD